MFQLVRQYGTVVDAAGVGVYHARAYGELQADGWWGGWLVFFPFGTGTAVATDRETTQTTFANLVRWSSTIGPVYLEGALERALLLQPAATITGRLAELALLERRAVEDAAVLETAAEHARLEAEAAEREAAAHERAAAAARAEARERAEAALALEDNVAVAEGRREMSIPGSGRTRRPRFQAADAARRRRRKRKPR
ncbi:MAG: hypothetical protein DMF98_07290 [Acidobacteria bacterium]|nr:MAG: hypothetical protein DMF98_07290 [Acidobacteriota bacterium]